jgi:hypothetical protein
MKACYDPSPNQNAMKRARAEEDDEKDEGHNPLITRSTCSCGVERLWCGKLINIRPPVAEMSCVVYNVAVAYGRDFVDTSTFSMAMGALLLARLSCPATRGGIVPVACASPGARHACLARQVHCASRAARASCSRHARLLLPQLCWSVSSRIVLESTSNTGAAGKDSKNGQRCLS